MVQLRADPDTQGCYYYRAASTNMQDPDPDPAFHLDSDPDPAYHVDTDPDPACQVDADPNPTVHFDADPDPSFQIKAKILLNVIKQVHIPYSLAYHLQIDVDPDPAYHFDEDADPDPAYHFDADPDPTFNMMRILILPFNLMRIHADPGPQDND